MTRQDELAQDKGKHGLYVPTHTHKVMGNRWKQSGQGRQSDRWEHTRGRGKLPETRGELDVKIKQEATRQHRHKTELKITNLTSWT